MVTDDCLVYKTLTACNVRNFALGLGAFSMRDTFSHFSKEHDT
jgi:hypothetical protein